MKNIFNILCEKAKRDEPPIVNVAGRTLAFIAANEISKDWFWDRPLMWVAALSSAIAIPVVVLAIMLHDLWISPLFEISQAISWVM